MATLKEIAEALDITPTAVSYVLNGRYNKVSEATRQRVLDAAREMGYQPHHAARALKTGETRTITVLSRSPHAPYYIEVLDYMIQHILAHDYKVLIQRLQWPSAPDEAASLVNGGVDGAVVIDAPPVAATMRRFERSRSRKLPIVSIGFYYDEDADHVGVDLSLGVEEAVRHLWQLGCHRIACLIDATTYDSNVNHTTSESPGEERQFTYLRVLEELGVTPEFIIAPEQTRESAHETLSAYTAEYGCPEGIFCINDAVADGALRALRDSGLRVPHDVAVVGCDGLRESAYAHPPLSTVAQPLEAMCAQAWGFLANRIQNPALPPQQTVLAAHLVVRESSQGFVPNSSQ